MRKERRGEINLTKGIEERKKRKKERNLNRLDTEVLHQHLLSNVLRKRETSVHMQ